MFTVMQGGVPVTLSTTWQRIRQKRQEFAGRTMLGARNIVPTYTSTQLVSETASKKRCFRFDERCNVSTKKKNCSNRRINRKSEARENNLHFFFVSHKWCGLSDEMQLNIVNWYFWGERRRNETVTWRLLGRNGGQTMRWMIWGFQQAIQKLQSLCGAVRNVGSMRLKRVLVLAQLSAFACKASGIDYAGSVNNMWKSTITQANYYPEQ